MVRGRKLKIFMSIALVFSILIPSIWYLYIKENEEKKQESVDEVKGEDDISGVPYITNIAPISVYEGEEYTYTPQFVDVDTNLNDLTLELLEAPSWLSIEENTIAGIAPIGSKGTYKFVAKISDGENSSVRENYILVESSDEN
ncbi:MAG: Ig domain-containing protein [Candidatus Dojkabacteria bacterium]